MKFVILNLFIILSHLKCFHCFQSINLLGLYIEWQNQGEQTEFRISSPLGSIVDVNSAWLAVGINNAAAMSGTNAIVCQNSASKSSVSHLINQGKSPTLMDANNPSVGLTMAKIATFQQSGLRPNLTCSFKRNNVNNTIPGYINIDQNSRFYLITAYGPGTLFYHFLNRASSANKVGFAQNATGPVANMESDFLTNISGIFITITHFFGNIVHLIRSLFTSQ